MTTSILLGEACEGHVLHVAISDIYDELYQEKLRMEYPCRIVPEQRSEQDIRQMVLAQSLDAPDLIVESSNWKSWESAPIINLVDSLLLAALKQRATDIHLEPSGTQLRVRFRRDGMLEEYRLLPKWIAEPVLVRLKILANADIAERRLPHDGSFSFQGFAGPINVRLSTIPTQDGEKCVLRLLPENDSGATLESLGFSPTVLQELRRIFKSPQGLFLVTGPTGSGKTTTLYAGLREILQQEINVSTIEDPVEYRLDGANQVQVNEKCGFTFAAALRALLRQDPDVILVGEIRDEETARIALRSAQTGHLVLSTLHTNSAKAAYSRLQDLGISPSLLQDSLLGIFAQRLVRKLRPHHDKEYEGRIAIAELLVPCQHEGSAAESIFVDGTLQDNAKRMASLGITDETEIKRVLGFH